MLVTKKVVELAQMSVYETESSMDSRWGEWKVKVLGCSKANWKES